MGSTLGVSLSILLAATGGLQTTSLNPLGLLFWATLANTFVQFAKGAALGKGW